MEECWWRNKHMKTLPTREEEREHCGENGWLPCLLVVVIPDAGKDVIITWIKGGGQKENTWRDCLRFRVKKLSWKSLHTVFYDQLPYLTFLCHVVHAIGHSGALLSGVESQEASIIIYEVVVFEKKTKRFELQTERVTRSVEVMEISLFRFILCIGVSYCPVLRIHISISLPTSVNATKYTKNIWGI